MLKKLLAVTLSLSMTLTAAASIFATSASAATLSPPLFDKTVNDASTVIASEDFERGTPDTNYTQSGSNYTITLNMTGITTPGVITTKKETGNQYALLTGCVPTDKIAPRFNKSFTKTANTLMLSFDYRNLSGSINVYGGGKNGTADAANALTTKIAKTTITNTSLKKAQLTNPSATDGAGETVTTSLPSDNTKWRNATLIYATAQNLIHIYIDGAYIGTSGYRKQMTEISSFWVGIQNGKCEIDNLVVKNMGTTDDTWYHFNEVEKHTFDPGTTIPFSVLNTVGNGAITADGKFKMTSTSDKNGVTKHYNYNMKSGKTLKNYSKISFDWYVKDAAAGTAPVMHMYVNGTTPTGSTGQIGTTVSFYENKVSAIKVNGGTAGGDVKTGLTEGWHTFDMLLDLVEHKIYYVVDDTVSSVFPFRNNLDEVTLVFFRIYATSEEDEAQIDNLTFYNDGTKYFAPTLKSSTLSIDNVNQTITMTEDIANSLTDMDDIENLITSDVACTIKANDVDKNGYFSDGDTVMVTAASTGASYKYVVDVTKNIETSIEALIVKGGDGQGDDFCRVGTITKAGNAEIELRIKNNFPTSITPLIMAASYDDNGRMVSMSMVDKKTIASGATVDVDLTANLLSNLSAGKLKIVVWKNADSIEPLMKPITYAVDTNDFTVPTVISNDMVLQRNSTAYIFGSAPEGATVTASLDDGTTASYTVPAGSNEYFAGLELGDYNATAQNLTISAVDANGVEMGTVTRTGVLIGDVYYGGGQSNMTRNFSGTATEIRDGKSDVYSPDEYNQFVEDYKALVANLSKVRCFTTVAGDNYTPRDSYTAEQLASKETWKNISASNIGSLSEVMIRMAAELATAEPDVPLGIIVSAQGGTKLAKWVSRDALLSSVFDSTEKNEYESNLTNTSDPTRWASHTDLYYTGVRPLMPYGIKAAVWYQGESDSSSNYDKYLKAMIDEFRAGMRNENLSYIIVGLPGYVSGTWTEGTNPSGDGVAKKRLLQWNAQNQLSNVYTVVTNDTGDNGNIHPANKVDVADRLARYVRANLLGENVPYTGPTMNSVTYGNGTASVKVDLYGGTLKKYDPTEGANLFHLHDGTSWKVADSITVSGDTVTVGCSAITGEVKGVRYAYGNEITKCIYAEFADGAKLPLVPFDTKYVYNVLN